jgi:hypothetical protein
MQINSFPVLLPPDPFGSEIDDFCDAARTQLSKAFLPFKKPQPQNEGLIILEVITDNLTSVGIVCLTNINDYQENKLQINYTHYITNQLMKPLQQLFGLALEQIWKMHGNESKLKQYKTSLLELEKDCAGNLEIFMKKKEKIASSEIKQLLFDEFLTKIYQTQNRIRTLDSFWNKK